MTASEPTPDGLPQDGPIREGPIQHGPTEPTGNAGGHSFMDDLAEPEPVRSQGGFSLASLFLLVTAAGVIALVGRTIVETDIEVTVVAVHAIIGGFVGGIAGAIIGTGYPRPLSSGLIGWFVGTLTGAICAATAASGGSPWLFVVGAAALVGLGIASRWILRG
ncbi:MAG TPA: hypothetical protein VG826_00445 [Pirellulales bacterium]|nr:hypothetical protein [Pirellulales bacterium]